MAAIWGALTAVLGNLVKTQAGFWLASLLGAFGLHLAATEFVVEPAMAEVQSHINGLGADVLAWFAFLRIDECLTITLSAYAAAASMSAVRLMRKPA